MTHTKCLMVVLASVAVAVHAGVVCEQGRVATVGRYYPHGTLGAALEDDTLDLVWATRVRLVLEVCGRCHAVA